MLRALDFGSTRDAAEIHPLAVIASGRKRPSPAHTISAVHLLRLAGGRIRRRVHDTGIRAPYLLLGFEREERELPRMHSDNSGHPAMRTVGARNFGHRLEELGGIALAAAPSRGLQSARNAGLEERLPRRVGQAPQPGGLVGGAA